MHHRRRNPMDWTPSVILAAPLRTHAPRTHARPLPKVEDPPKTGGGLALSLPVPPPAKTDTPPVTPAPSHARSASPQIQPPAVSAPSVVVSDHDSPSCHEDIPLVADTTPPLVPSNVFIFSFALHCSNDCSPGGKGTRMTSTPSATVRAFVAVDLPESVRTGLARLQDALRQGAGQDRGLRWVSPESIHLTLKFLGDIPQDSVDGIAEALGSVMADSPPFQLGFDELGAFPNLARPRVLWLGLKGDVAVLRELQKSVEDSLAALGFPAEGRDFSPHLTLARVRNGQRVDGRQVVEGCAPGEYLGTEPILVNQVVLMRSTLRPQGAVYTRLWEGKFENHSAP